MSMGQMPPLPPEKGSEHDEEMIPWLLYRIGQELAGIRDILSRLAPPRPRSVAIKILDGGVEMGQPVQVHIDSTTAAATLQGFSGPNGTGSPILITGPAAFSGDNDAVATIDPNTGKITPVSLGVVNFTGKDMGDLDASGVPLVDTTQVTIVAEPPPPPPKPQSVVLSITQ
jgi:hypothetical protein